MSPSAMPSCAGAPAMGSETLMKADILRLWLKRRVASTDGVGAARGRGATQPARSAVIPADPGGAKRQPGERRDPCPPASIVIEALVSLRPTGIQGPRSR